MYFNVTKCLTLIFCAFPLSLLAKDVKNDAPQSLQKPLCFIENKGQIMDENNHICKDIQFRLSSPGMNLLVGNSQLHYEYKKIEDVNHTSYNATTYRMDVILEGANRSAKVVPADQQEYYENYYLSQVSTGGFTVHAYNKITYKDVYPGIDWVLYVKDNNVEYDFVVRPGGNPSDIKLTYEGADKLAINPDGSLFATTPMGDITAKRPYAYETKTAKAVASDFVLNGNCVSFKTGDYKGSLTIDPYLSWSTYYGGTGEDVVTSLKVTAGGNTFVGGYTASNTAISTVGSTHAAYLGGTYDAFFAKFNSTTSALQYATYFGGGSNDQGMAIAIDNTGGGNPAVYLGGYTSSNPLAGGVTTGGAFRGNTDGFLAKFTNAGALTWDTYYGGPGNDYIYSVTCDASNNPIIVGQTASATGIATAGAYQLALSGGTDAFIAKFNSGTGAVTWSTYYGGSAEEDAAGVATDPSGNIYITGQTNSIINMATTSSFQPALNGTNDAFIAEFNSSGVRQWGTYFGGPGLDQGNAIAYDPIYGNIAIVGVTTSTSGVASANGYQTAYGGGTQDAFIAYFTTAGSQLWSSFYGGPSTDYGQSICFDPAGNIIIAGGTFSTSAISSPVVSTCGCTGALAATAFQSAIGGDYDAYVAKIDPFSQLLWASYFGGTLYDYANTVACNANWQITLGGYTSSIGTNGLYGNGGIATSGAQQTLNNGGTYDGFITKFNADTLVTIKQLYTDTLVCAGGTLNVVWVSNYAFPNGNNMSIQMSSSTGSFSAPSTIGSAPSVASATTGTVTCTVPLAALGTGYRIRVVASNPVYVSPDDYYNIHVVSALAPSTATASTPTCVGDTIYFYDSALYAITGYAWTGPNGFTSTLQNAKLPNAVLASAGNYSVTTQHNGCPVVTNTVTVVVNSAIPPTPFDSSSSPNCTGNTLYLFSRPDTSATVTYHWSGPAGFSSTAQNPTITGISSSNSGNYTVVDSMQGCPSAASTLTIDVLPTTPTAISISITPSDTICSGGMVTFTAIPTNGGTTPHYQWMSDAFSPIVGAISNTFSSSSLVNGETIYCVLQSNVICPLPATAVSNVIAMNVIDVPPIVAIYASPGTVVTPGTTVNFTSAVYDAGTSPIYQWQLNGKNIAGANSPTLSLTGASINDTVSLTVTSIMHCAIPDFDVATLIIMPPTSVPGVASPFDNVLLFPNPNSGSFAIKGSLTLTDVNFVSLEIINPLGQLVYSTRLPVLNNELDQTITISNLPDGIYLARLGAGVDSKTFRVTVAH